MTLVMLLVLLIALVPLVDLNAKFGRIRDPRSISGDSEVFEGGGADGVSDIDDLGLDGGLGGNK